MKLLHHNAEHRSRQLRWVVPLLAFVLAAVVATLAVQYRVSDQAVGAEFFRAHKTIAHTGELLRRGLVMGSAVLLLLMLTTALWAFRLTHRIVRPVHTLHRALDALCAGDLGVRVELHREDEFAETGAALNRLVDEFADVLSQVHALVDRLAALTPATAASPEDPRAAQLGSLVGELDRTLEFFRLEPRHAIREDD